MTEIWRDIPGYEGLYQVSNQGQVKSLRFNKERLLSNRSTDSKGYRVVHLYNGQTSSVRSVHSLVALAFLGESPKGHDVNHIDGDRLNNDLSNLEIITHRENILHGFRVLGRTILRGEYHGRAKASQRIVLEIFRLASEGVPRRKIAELAGVSTAQVGAILRRRAWAHVEIPEELREAVSKSRTNRRNRNQEQAS